MLSGAGVVDKVTAAAKAALPGWANTPPLKRARIMFNYKALLEENLDALAEAISTQHGKTKEDAWGGDPRRDQLLSGLCGIRNLLRGDYTRNVGPAVDSFFDRQPLGVVAGITFSTAMVPMRMCSPWLLPVATPLS